MAKSAAMSRCMGYISTVKKSKKKKIKLDIYIANVVY